MQLQRANNSFLLVLFHFASCFCCCFHICMQCMQLSHCMSPRCRCMRLLQNATGAHDFHTKHSKTQKSKTAIRKKRGAFATCDLRLVKIKALNRQTNLNRNHFHTNRTPRKGDKYAISSNNNAVHMPHTHTHRHTHTYVTLLTTKCRLPRNFATFSQSPLNFGDVPLLEVLPSPCFWTNYLHFLLYGLLFFAIYTRHSRAVLAFDMPWRRIYACRRCFLFAPPTLWPYAILCAAIFVVALWQLIRWHLYICTFMRICTQLTATLVTFGRVWLLHLVRKRYAN